MVFWIRFPIFIAASYVVFAWLVWFVLRRRTEGEFLRPILVLGLLVVVGGMVFAKVGQNTGWPWWIYYTVPMLLTVFLPPVYFKMRRRELPEYLILSFLSAPAIHLTFSFLVGWKNYMPFIEIPSLWEMLQ